ncbi:MAG TPA: hypothetical protein VLB87_10180 [Pyrinomonadaceae bacterium]|nr:hypothetical protein [Pyrinomonadaceae bacterium]
MLRVVSLLLLLITLFATSPSTAETYDLVILNGRVIDPESKTDAVRNLGVSNGKIKTISTNRLTGRNVIDARAGKSLINYGVSAGHLAARMAAMKEPVTFLPTGEAARRAATDAEIDDMKARVEQGLKRGAVAVGFGIQYTPQASRWEILELFRLAARYGASCHVHMRHAGAKEPSSVQALEEVIAAAAITGAPFHVVHIHSTGGPGLHKKYKGLSST